MKKTLIMLLLWMGHYSFGYAQQVRYTYFEIADFSQKIRRVELRVEHMLFIVDGEGELHVDIDRRGRSPHSQDLEIEYYDNFDKNKAGKIKSVNGIDIDYYSSFDIHDQPRKLKSIGNISFKYNNKFDIHDQPGTLKSIGDVQIKYNTAFDINENKGSVKSIGPVRIGWYGIHDPERSKGKVKFIRGNTNEIFVVKQLGRRGRD